MIAPAMSANDIIARADVEKVARAIRSHFASYIACNEVARIAIEALDLPARDAAMRAEGRAEGLREAAAYCKAQSVEARTPLHVGHYGEDATQHSVDLLNYIAAAILALITKESSDANG